MKRLLFILLSLLCIASSCFATPANHVCVAVYAMSGYDSLDVSDNWYTDTYNQIAKELSIHGIQSRNASEVWSDFVISRNRMGKVFTKDEVKQAYTDFRKDRFDHIIQFKTDKFVSYPQTNTCDVAVTMTVKNAKDYDGEPLLVYKDSAFYRPASEREAILSSMIKDMISCYVHS